MSADNEQRATQLATAGDECEPKHSEEVVDALVRDLNAVHARASLQAALAMGELIVERFYGGDSSLWRARRAKDSSFRRLAARRDLSVSVTYLYRAVALYDLKQRIGSDLFARLTVTHLRIVLGLPYEKQSQLLQAAKDNGWSPEVLERHAHVARSTAGKRMGRPSTPRILRTFRKLAATWQEIEYVLNEDGTELVADQVCSLYTSIDELRARMDRALRRLTSRPSNGNGASTATIRGPLRKRAG